MTPRRRSRKRIVWIVCLVLLAIAASGAWMTYRLVRQAGPQVSAQARQWVIDWLSAKYQAEVDLGDFQVKVGRRVSVEGSGLVLYYHGRHDIPPILSIRHFSVAADLKQILQPPRHVSHVKLDGVVINIPPHPPASAKPASPYTPTPAAEVDMQKAASIIVDSIDCDRVILSIYPRDKNKTPQVYNISKLDMRNRSANGAMSYKAVLSNPVPAGDIDTSGEFGPWHGADPGATPVSGDFTYQNADLSTLQGIGGILSSKGRFTGILENLEVEGATDTPDFVVTSGDHKVHLTTKYQAVVDGTNGDTLLQPVEAHFRKTTLITRGSVEGKHGVPGKTITLDLVSTQARIEDLLALAVKGDPSMTGDVRIKTKFILTPGKAQIADRLFLDGSFDVDEAHFTSNGVQTKFDQLSNRGRGEMDPVDQQQNVASSMSGKFILKDAEISFSDLSFDVPGAHIQLAGTYNVDTEAIDFLGSLATQAKVSQMTTGAKSLLLKVVDPFFAKNGYGAVLPIRINGTAQQPNYALDLHRKSNDKTAANHTSK